MKQCLQISEEKWFLYPAKLSINCEGILKLFSDTRSLKIYLPFTFSQQAIRSSQKLDTPEIYPEKRETRDPGNRWTNVRQKNASPKMMANGKPKMTGKQQA